MILLNPPGLTNTDAREQNGTGVLGYHGFAQIPYAFVNLLGTGFQLGDPSDLFAEALSHEIAEMTVDPRADDSNPEVCDGCGTNCNGAGAYRVYFGPTGEYLGGARRSRRRSPTGSSSAPSRSPRAPRSAPPPRGRASTRPRVARSAAIH